MMHYFAILKVVFNVQKNGADNEQRIQLTDAESFRKGLVERHRDTELHARSQKTGVGFVFIAEVFVNLYCSFQCCEKFMHHLLCCCLLFIHTCVKIGVPWKDCRPEVEYIRVGNALTAAPRPFLSILYNPLFKTCTLNQVKYLEVSA